MWHLLISRFMASAWIASVRPTSTCPPTLLPVPCPPLSVSGHTSFLYIYLPWPSFLLLPSASQSYLYSACSSIPNGVPCSTYVNLLLKPRSLIWSEQKSGTGWTCVPWHHVVLEAGTFSSIFTSENLFPVIYAQVRFYLTFICSHLPLRACEAGTALPSCIVQLLCSANHPMGKKWHQGSTGQVDVYPLSVVALGMFASDRARTLSSCSHPSVLSLQAW